ncbi:hypothetical protein KSP39_PZI000706 [Platanthera zijinensis]|uniref:HAT C-terminal dimerisation domain-containing protein n=1 Tax=Platanthera zijinensis TaxID=2320716 RepID=A0AAP0C0C0_9ASPA
MLKRAICQKILLMEFYTLLGQHELIESDWAILENYMDLLEVFYTATNSLLGLYDPTSLLVIENIVNISQKLNYFKQHAGWIELIKIMEIKILKYYREIPVMFSCALNSLFGVDGVENFIEEINNNIDVDLSDSLLNFNTIFTECYNYYDNLYGSRSREDVSQLKTFSSFKNKMLELASRKKMRTTSSSLNELELYAKTQFRDFMFTDELENFDILKWWKGKVNTYPIMAYMVRDLLTIKASTVASESAFDLSGRVLNERRSRLREESLEIYICYKDHLDAMKRKQYISAIEDSSSDMEDEMDAINLN